MDCIFDKRECYGLFIILFFISKWDVILMLIDFVVMSYDNLCRVCKDIFLDEIHSSWDYD